MSNLEIDEKRKPQDGRFRINDLGKTIDFVFLLFRLLMEKRSIKRILDTQTGYVEFG